MLNLHCLLLQSLLIRVFYYCLSSVSNFFINPYLHNCYTANKNNKRSYENQIHGRPVFGRPLINYWSNIQIPTVAFMWHVSIISHNWQMSHASSCLWRILHVSNYKWQNSHGRSRKWRKSHVRTANFRNSHVNLIMRQLWLLTCKIHQLWLLTCENWQIWQLTWEIHMLIKWIKKMIGKCHT